MIGFRLFPRVLLMSALVLFGLSASNVFSATGATLPVQAPASPEGYFLGPEVEISPQITPTDPNRYHPSAAYNDRRAQYLVVWHNTWASGHDREVIGQRVDGYGHLIGSNFAISTGTHDRIQPAVAYNHDDDEYMVVWMYDVNGDEKKYDIWGVVVSWNGVVGAPFEIESYSEGSFWSPKIAWNSNSDEYAVVWGSLDKTTQIATGIGTEVRNKDGGLEYGTVLWSTGFPTNPDITYDSINHNYLVVWNYVNTSGKNVVIGDLRNDLYNRVRTVDVFGSTANQALYPRVDSSMGLFFLVTFEYENSPTDHDIYVAFVNNDATSAIPTSFVSGATHDVYPDVAGSQQRFEFMIAYQRADVNGAKVLLRPLSNYLPLNDIDICNYFSTDCLSPTAIPSAGGFFFGYLVDTPISVLETRQHVFGRIFFGQTVYLPVISK
jgi:hypothetical protein